MRAWLTPDDPPGDPTCFRVVIPGGEVYEAALRGALALLTEPENWEQIGSQTPLDTAQAFLDSMFVTYQWRRCVDIGVVFWFAGFTPPTHSLLCDGAVYNIEDYPLLAAQLGDMFGGNGWSTFGVPDIRDRFIWGQHEEGTPPTGIGSTGGTVEHTLAANEMPAHLHSQPSHAHAVAPHTHPTTVGTLPIVAAPGVLPADGPSIPGATGPDTGQNTSAAGAEDTGSTGGGEAHNNMPPYIALRAYIYCD